MCEALGYNVFKDNSLWAKKNNLLPACQIILLSKLEWSKRPNYSLVLAYRRNAENYLIFTFIYYI